MADLIPIRQTSFAAGEIHPELQGRTDWDKYGSAVKLMRNWIAAPTGPALNRPGTRYVAIVDSTLVAKKWRLIPFYFSNDTAYQIVLTDHLMRVYAQDGTFLSNIPTVGTPVPYAGADLEQLKYHQLGNAIFVTRHGYPPAMIRRIADNNWLYIPNDYTVSGFLKSSDLTGKAAVENPAGSDGALGRFLCPIYNSGQIIGVGDYVVGSDGKTYISHTILALNTDPNPAINPGLNVELAIDGVHPALNRQYQVTIEWQDIFGDIHESGTVWTSFFQRIAAYTDRPVSINAGGLDPARPPNFSRLIRAKYYKGVSDDVMGFIGFGSIGSTFIDNGITEDFTQSPPKGTDPSQFFDVAGNPFNSYPAVSALIGQRLSLANFDPAQYLIRSSEVANFQNFDPVAVQKDDSPFDLPLFSETLNDIRSMVMADTLLVFCGSSEWSVKFDQVFAITSVDPKPQSRYGSSWLTPLKVGDKVLFATVLGTTVREIAFNFQANKFLSKDLSLYAQHLFTDNYTYLCDWAYADIPYKIVWGVLENGNLVGVTYSNEHEVVAWHHHDSPGGKFLATSTVPAGTETGVFFLVDRNGIIFMEKFASRIMTDQRYSCFLDCSFEFDSRGQTGGASISLGTIPLGGTDVQITRLLGNPFTDTDIGSQVVVFPDAETSYRFTVTAIQSADVVTATAEQDVPDGQAWTAGTTEWEWARTKFILPIAEYDGTELTAVGDGAYIGPIVVAGDHSVTLDQPAMVVQVGIPYNADLELLDAHSPNAETTIIKKLVKRVWLEVNKTRGLQIGQTYDTLQDVNQRETMTPAILLPATKKLLITPKTSWDTSGSIIIRQAYPLPATIISVVREVEFGGT